MADNNYAQAGDILKYIYDREPLVAGKILVEMRKEAGGPTAVGNIFAEMGPKFAELIRTAMKEAEAADTLSIMQHIYYATTYIG